MLLLVLCLVAFVSGEGGVYLLHLPWGYALVVAIVSAGLGMLSWQGGGGRVVLPKDEAFEHFIREMAAHCPWMTRKDIVLLRWAFCPCHPSLLLNQEVDVVANAALSLAERAREAGDLGWAGVFEFRYQDVCAWKQGTVWPPLPHP